ncbi:40S ribosomal protein S20 [Cichlidogyrus casuarinus]|uniref:Small ribosomal subunit protein uS10 n=1 Tax=Cichlidogyrus casuarinus TaxID=1844966 RepID=A0ABD2Q6V9_9PLAT
MEKKPDLQQTASSNVRIRITISSQDTAPLRKAVEDIIGKSTDMQMKVKGPRYMPTKTLRITTRKTPCGEGSKTWDRFQLRIHKRIIDLYCTSENSKRLSSIHLEPGVQAVIQTTAGV